MAFETERDPDRSSLAQGIERSYPTEPLRWFAGEIKDHLLHSLDAVGLDALRLCHQAGLPHHHVKLPGYRIGLKRIRLLLDHAEERSGASKIGLLLASRTPLGGAINGLMSAQETLGDALAVLESRQEAAFGSRPFGVQRRDGELLIRFNIGTRPEEHGSVTEYCMARLARHIQWLTGGAAAPKAVRFQHSHRAAAAAADYERFLGCPVTFATTDNALILAEASWATAVGYANARLADRFDRMVRAQCENSPQQSLRQRVLEALQDADLRRGDCARAAVARLLATSERTLQRRLEAEGTSFTEILGTTRQALALRLVVDNQRSVHEISELLGFSDQSSFSKAFRRWTGYSPSSYRLQRPS